MVLSIPVKMAIEKYNVNVRHLSYTISWHAQENKALVLDRNKVNNEILKFITQDATNVNFFVIDMQGNFIYQNEPLHDIIKDCNAKELDQEVWDNSVLVMKKKKQMIFEETDKHKDFLSFKYPLAINGEVEGVIGLAVDITERKRAEELEKKLAIQEGLYELAKRVAKDSPNAAYQMVRHVSKELYLTCEEEWNMFASAMSTIHEQDKVYRNLKK
jgi:hypothetical protein